MIYTITYYKFENYLTGNEEDDMIAKCVNRTMLTDLVNGVKVN